MARLPRLHVPGGVYYLVLRGNGGRRIFHSDADGVAFSRLVGRALGRTQARAHAFCWLRNQAILVVHISDVPIERFVRGVAGPYARRIHSLQRRQGHLFGPRYFALLIDDRKYLPALVRHVHWAPVRRRQATSPAAFDWSSHKAYLGISNVPWLTTTVVLRRLSPDADQRTAYREFMSRDNSRDLRAAFETGSPADSRAYGDDEFLALLSRESIVPRRRLRMSLEELTEAAAATFSVTQEEIRSLSRRRHLSLARAVLSWHAVQGGVTNLAQVARYLSRDPSTLSAIIQRYRLLRPDLFREPINKVTTATRAWPRPSCSSSVLAEQRDE